MFRPPRVAHSFQPTIGQIAAEKPTPWWPRWVNTALIAVGSGLALATYSSRSNPVGALAFGAAASVVGVGLTFLLVDVIDGSAA
jgi:hypothetical protein